MNQDEIRRKFWNRLKCTSGSRILTIRTNFDNHAVTAQKEVIPDYYLSHVLARTVRDSEPVCDDLVLWASELKEDDHASNWCTKLLHRDSNENSLPKSISLFVRGHRNGKSFLTGRGNREQYQRQCDQ